jgi:hypothetical protein
MKDLGDFQEAIQRNHLREGFTLDNVTPLENGSVRLDITGDAGQPIAYTVPVQDVRTIIRNGASQ